MVLEIATAAAMEALGARLAGALGSAAGATYFLYGELGAGKTTLVRGFLRALAYRGPVKSPTYTLVEPYFLIADRPIYHFDLYRLSGAEELEDLGIRDYFEGPALCFIEWPERGAVGKIPVDVELRIAVAGTRRRVAIEATSEKGRRMLADLEAQAPAPEPLQNQRSA